MLIGLSVFIFINSLVTGVLYFFWMRMPYYSARSSENSQQLTKLSVLIAVRNEAGKISRLLQDLEKQSFPKHLFEILILDDHSEDATALEVESFIKNSIVQIQLIKMPAELSGKKKAIEKGVMLANGDLIITTDGDCRVGEHWLTTVESFYRSQNLKMITGGVVFFKGNTLRERLLELEFSSLVGSGASSLYMGYPSMCNGANLAYEKAVFLELGGYQGTGNLASGDDEFLMHKIYKRYPGKVAFLRNTLSVVETEAPVSWEAFFNQRRRWASKWGNYTYTHIKLLALLVFGSNLSLIISFFMMLLGSYPPSLFLLLLTFKILLEFLFLRSVLVYFGRKVNVGVFLITEIVHPFYVVLFALLGRMGKYTWKSREIIEK